MKEMMNQKMGTHKFRFSDIMPHSWLYKLKGMRRSSRKHHPSSPKHLSSSDASSTRKLRDPLRRLSPTAHPQAPYSPPKSSSFKRKIKRKTVYKPSPRLKLSSSSSPNSHVSLTSRRSKSSSSANVIFDSAVESSSDRVSSPSDQNYSVSRVPKQHYSVDIKDNRSLEKPDDVSEDPSISASLSPLRVETAKEPSFEMMTEQKLKKQNALSSGIKIRAKMARKKTKERTFPVSKKRTVKSFAIVLSSVDPERDFRESMVEMIMENKMREQKDLEDLLACYLSLNSSEYHGVIIKAFEKTWLHLTHLT